MKIQRKRLSSGLKQINEDVQACQKCKLAKLSYNIKDISEGYGKLYGWRGGTKKCRLFFVGMNPSYNRYEDLEYAFGGKDFNRGTGIHFTKILKDIGIIEECFVDNIVKCSSKDNKINDIHIEHCLEHLEKELELLKPDKIIAMGKQVYDALLRNFDRDSKWVSKLFTIWHPNYVISYQRHLMSDYIKKIRDLAND